MAEWDQLEIVSATGEITFYDLSPAKGTTNIGGHPDNDIVLEGEQIAPFHAVLDHRQRPYQLIALDADTQIVIDGSPLAVNQSAPLANWGSVKLDGFTLILLERAGGGVSAPAAAPGAPPNLPVPGAAVSNPPPAPRVPPTPAPKSAAPGKMPSAASAAAKTPGKTPFQDRRDDSIVLNLATPEAAIEVEQTATFTATITNGGTLVATFNFAVEGVPAEWVTITPAQVNLYEGQSESIKVQITPPRHPGSRAGAHYLAIVATSGDYPTRSAQRAATLHLAPYYEFTVGELDPRQQTVGGRRAEGKALLHILNKGNAEAPFRLEAMDDERACEFEFQVPEDQQLTWRARHAELRLPPQETHGVPLRILPQKRPFIGLRSRNHTFTVTASLMAGEQTARSLLGAIRVRPLIGPLPLFLFLVTLAALIILIFRPGIRSFEPDAFEINAGDPVIFTWDATRFTNLWITGSDGTSQRLDRHTGQYTVNPKDDTVYTLYAENLLSMIPFLAVKPEPRAIDVAPLEPRIIFFRAIPPVINDGDSTTLYWEVINAETLTLEGPSGQETLDLTDTEYTDIPLAPGRARYVLRAGRSGAGEAVGEYEVIVNQKPLPEPKIISFAALPPRITQGDTVTITWIVQDATVVQLLENGVPTSGGYRPDEVRVVRVPPLPRTEYQIIAIYTSEDGREARTLSESLVIIAAEPTPEPEKPVIDDFRVVPAQVMLGAFAELTWSVSGETTNIEISGPKLPTTSNLDPKGSLRVVGSETTYFQLTAYNGELAVTKIIELTVVEPTPTPTPPPPPPVIEYFILQAVENASDVVLEDQDTNTIIYRVVPDALTRLNWRVVNSTNVFISGLGPQAPVGPSVNMQIKAPATYQLTAVNDAGQQTAYVQILLRPLTPPNPPYNVSGPTPPPANGSAMTITWQHTEPSRLTGFRLYRASAPNYNAFTMIRNETELTSATFAWADTVNPTCGQAYYVTAVYLDLDGILRETPSSTNWWYSWPCPSPSPTP